MADLSGLTLLVSHEHRVRRLADHKLRLFRLYGGEARRYEHRGSLVLAQRNWVGTDRRELWLVATEEGIDWLARDLRSRLARA